MANEYIGGARYVVFDRSRDEFHMYTSLADITSEWSKDEWDHYDCVCHELGNEFEFEVKFEMKEINR